MFLKGVRDFFAVDLRSLVRRRHCVRFDGTVFLHLADGAILRSPRGAVSSRRVERPLAAAGWV